MVDWNDGKEWWNGVVEWNGRLLRCISSSYVFRVSLPCKELCMYLSTGVLYGVTGNVLHSTGSAKDQLLGSLVNQTKK